MRALVIALRRTVNEQGQKIQVYSSEVNEKSHEIKELRESLRVLKSHNEALTKRSNVEKESFSLFKGWTGSPKPESNHLSDGVFQEELERRITENGTPFDRVEIF